MIFVLGGDGFLGKGITKILKEEGKNYKIINKTNYKKYINKKCDILINTSTNSYKYLAKKDYFYDFDNTVINISNSIKNFKFKKYILISSCEVYNDLSNKKFNSENSNINPILLSNYGLNKFLGELLVKKSCNKWLILRCNGLVGSHMKKNPIYDLLNNKKLYINPESKFQFLNTTYVGKVLNKLINKNIINEVFNVSGKNSISINKIAEILKIRKINLKRNPEVLNYNINVSKLEKIVKLPTTISQIRDLNEIY